MQYTTYIRKENEEAFKKVEKKADLINKLLAVYFQKHGKGDQAQSEPRVVETENWGA